ncbi:hypothetical protein ONZ43_g5791 [Nemania bipapillata]|uniref:Uncharacterized protein n=1 Tax=Nemania bipapillata TaxID=110536 RepID=A0ACC2I6H9_9PEZI|nr:hypothetical protein ONZ43_g5791 [Nemania bipapillata]
MPPPRGSFNPIEGPGDYDTTSVIHNDTYPAIDPTKADLTGKAIFITGGTRGIGKGIGISFAKAGASMIAIGARSELSETVQAIKAAATSAGKPEPKILSLKIDVTSQASVDAAATKIKEAFGRIDIVVNNAGVLSGRGLIAETDPDAWWNTMVVNVKGPYLVMRALIPLMLESDGLKTFVTVSSVGAHCRTPMGSAYQTSKLAVLRLTEFLDAEYSGKGIIAFTIHPGNIPTDMTVGADNTFSKELAHIFVETPELTGDSVVYLTAERRDWLGGRYINVTWDLPELMGFRDEIVEKDKLKVQLVL